MKSKMMVLIMVVVGFVLGQAASTMGCVNPVALIDGQSGAQHRYVWVNEPLTLSGGDSLRCDNYVWTCNRTDLKILETNKATTVMVFESCTDYTIQLKVTKSGKPDNTTTCVVHVRAMPAEAFYVSPTGNNANPGTAASPFATIQHAINQVPVGSEKVIRLLASGASYCGVGNRDIVLPTDKLVAIIGEGGPAGCTLNCSGSEQDWHRAFIYQSGATRSPWVHAIKNIRIIGGYHSIGGALYGENTNLVVGGCVFEGNTSSNVVYADGGAISCHSNANFSIYNVVLRGNRSIYGGAMCSWGSSPSVLNCTLIGNTASYGGGLSVIYKGFLQVRNNIFYENTAPTNCGHEISVTEGNPYVDYNDVKGGRNEVYGQSTLTNWGVNNVASDPCYVNSSSPWGSDNKRATSDDGLQLKNASLCKDAGDGSSTYLACIGSKDILGQTRTVTNGKIDMGAYEYVASASPEDTFPYETSFEAKRGYKNLPEAGGTMEEVDGWKVTNNAYVRGRLFCDKDVNHSQYPYQCIEIGWSGLIGGLYRNFSSFTNSNRVVRISCIPDKNATIQLKYGSGVVAGIRFGSTNLTDNQIYLWDQLSSQYVGTGGNGTPFFTVAAQCRTFMTNTNPDLADYSYENTWIELEFHIDWNNHNYQVFWQHYGTAGQVQLGGVYSINAAFNCYDKIEFNKNTQSDYAGFYVNRVSVSDEFDGGGSYEGASPDICITEPLPEQAEPLEGHVTIKGSVWFDRLGEYRLKCCPVKEDPQDPCSWTQVDMGYSPRINDTLGYWDAWKYKSGDYYLKLEVYDDLGRLLNSTPSGGGGGGFTPTILIPDNINIKSIKTISNIVYPTPLYIYHQLPPATPVVRYAKYSLSSRLQGQQTFHHEPPADITINWPGSFPFEFRRIYDDASVGCMKPLFFGWTHNHNIRVVEDTTVEWEMDQTLAEADGWGLGIGRLYLIEPWGTKMYKGHLLNGQVKYIPIDAPELPLDNYRDYILREVTHVDNPTQVDITYTHHGPDGKRMVFEQNGLDLKYPLPASPATEDAVVYWMVNKAVDVQEDRFGNALDYTYDAEGDLTEITTRIPSLTPEQNPANPANPVSLVFTYMQDIKLIEEVKIRSQIDQQLVTKEALKFQWTAGSSRDVGSNSGMYWWGSTSGASSCVEGFYDAVKPKMVLLYEAMKRKELDDKIHQIYYYELTSDDRIALRGITADGSNEAQWDIARDKNGLMSQVLERGHYSDSHLSSPTDYISALIKTYSYDYDPDLDQLLTKVQYSMPISTPSLWGRVGYAPVLREEEIVTDAQGAVLQQTLRTYINYHEGLNGIPDFSKGFDPYCYVELEKSDYNYIEEFGYSCGGGGTKQMAYTYGNQNFPTRPTEIQEYLDEDGDGMYEYAGRKTIYQYDDYGNVVNEKVCSDATHYQKTAYEYHPLYNLPISQTTWQGYNETGSIVEKQWVYGAADGTPNPQGAFLVKERQLLDGSGPEVWKEQSYTYNGYGRVLTTRDSYNQLVARVVYDPNGRPTEIYKGNNASPSQRFYHDAFGQKLLEADALGKVVHYDYHDQNVGRIVKARTYYDTTIAVTREDFHPGVYAPTDIEKPDATDWYKRKTEYSYSTGELPLGFKAWVYEIVLWGNYYGLPILECYYHREWNNTIAKDYYCGKSYYKGLLEDQELGLPPDGSLGYEAIDAFNKTFSFDGRLLSQFAYSSQRSDWSGDCFSGHADPRHCYAYTMPTHYVYDAMNRLMHRYEFNYDGVHIGMLGDVNAPGLAVRPYLRHTEYGYYPSGQKRYEKVWKVIRDMAVPPQVPTFTPVLESHTRYTYDAFDRLAKQEQIMASGPSIVSYFGYDAVGNQIYVIDPKGKVLLTDYDNANNKVREYFAAAPVGLNLNSPTCEWIHVAATRTAAVCSRHITYDRNNRQESVTAYDYTSVILAYSRFEYDVQNRVTEVWQTIDSPNPANAVNTASYIYDDAPDADYEIQIVDAKDKYTRIALNEEGKTSQIVYPSGDYQAYTYNSRGLLEDKTVFDENGVSQVVHYDYDHYGKVSRVTYPDGGYIDYEYTDRILGDMGKVKKVSDYRVAADRPGGLGSTYLFQYDGITENILSYTDADGFVINYDYNLAYNRKTSVQVKTPTADYPATSLPPDIGRDQEIYKATYAYDLAGRLTQVRDMRSSSSNLLAGFGYDLNGNRSTLTYYRNGNLYGPTTAMAYSHDADNNLTGYTTTGGPAFSLANTVIDGLGRLRNGTDQIEAISSNLSYSYDQLSQLTSATMTNINGSTWMGGYTYREDGNIETQTINGSPTSFGYTGDLMTYIADQSLDWDDNGNLTSTPAMNRDIVWNYANKLRSAEVDYQDGPYLHRRRLECTYTPGGIMATRRMLHDGHEYFNYKYLMDPVGEFPTLLMVLHKGALNDVQESYVPADGQTLVRYGAGANPGSGRMWTAQKYYYLHDRLGSVRGVVDDTGELVIPVIYDPYGNALIGWPGRFGFAGYLWDETAGQYYCHARWYDPQMMRFTARDPVKGNFREPMTLHKYLYCLNDPLNRIDPTGKTALQIVAGVIAGSAMHSAAIQCVAEGVGRQDDYLMQLGFFLEQQVGAAVWAGALVTQPGTMVSTARGIGLIGRGLWSATATVAESSFYIAVGVAYLAVTNPDAASDFIQQVADDPHDFAPRTPAGVGGFLVRRLWNYIFTGDIH